MVRDLVQPGRALAFGIALGIAATLILGLAANWLSAALALVANLYYVFVYTMALKRRTAQNIVWGGIAGCFPPLIGWTAVTGSVAWTPLVLFAIVFAWTPPHTWALARCATARTTSTPTCRCCRWSHLRCGWPGGSSPTVR